MTRIALVLRGRASLGSYTAGACSELLLALDGNRADDPAVIDVISGGSAGGGFTAALVARTLVVNRHLMPWIERCWVDALDADNLFPASGRGRPGLLDGGALDELGRGLIAAQPAADDQPHVAFSDSLRIGFADGWRREGRAATFTLGAQCDARDRVWEDVSSAAVGEFSLSTALPGVGLDQDPWGGSPSTAREATIDLARVLAAGEQTGDEERIYVVIDPGSGAPAETAEKAGTETSYAVDSGSRQLLDALIARLPEIVDRLDDPQALALGRHVGDLAERAAALESGTEIDDERLMDIIDASLDRIEHDTRWAHILTRPDSRSGRTRLAKLIYILEAACSAGAGRAPVSLIAPAAPDSLACRFLDGLGGFFDREWRQADFRAGRRDARDGIERSLAAWIDYEPDEEDSYRVPRQLAEVRVGGLSGLFGGWRNAVKKHAADRVLASLRS
jgi:hypothetical protein